MGVIIKGVMLRLSKHSGQGLYPLHFDGAQCDSPFLLPVPFYPGCNKIKNGTITG